MQKSSNETLIENTLRHHISETQALLFVEAIKHKYNIVDFVKKILIVIYVKALIVNILIGKMNII